MKISYRARNSPPCANRSHCAHRAQRSPPARSWPRSGSGSSSVQPPALGRGGRRRRGRGGGERDPRPLPASPGGRRCPANAAVPLRAPVTSRRGDLVDPSCSGKKRGAELLLPDLSFLSAETSSLGGYFTHLHIAFALRQASFT